MIGNIFTDHANELVFSNGVPNKKFLSESLNELLYDVCCKTPSLAVF